MAIARQRETLLRHARRWFESHNILNIDTPTLGTHTVTDPNIDSLRIASEHGPVYLQTSPEYYMKRLLASNYPDIYAICRVFRGGEVGRRHLPEFTMIEWYRHDFSLSAIVKDTLGLIAHVLNDPAMTKADVLEYSHAFETFARVNPVDASFAELANAAAADDDLVRSLAGNRNGLLDLILASKVSPCFAADRLTVVQHYPQDQGALARRCPADASVADRFEVFLGTLELANGYVELTDAGEQADRMRADSEMREVLAKPAVNADPNLLAALASGLPACAGVAVGFERLHMIAAGVDDIREVVTFY